MTPNMPAAAEFPPAAPFSGIHARPRQTFHSRTIRHLRWWIIAYLFLWLFEGAVRKWLLPQLSGPLLLVRDPIAAGIWFLAYRANLLTHVRYQVVLCGFGALVILAALQIANGVGSIQIAAFGIRCYVLHLPLMFVIGDTLDSYDVRRIARQLLTLSLPMSALMALQYSAASNSVWNAGTGETLTQLESAAGHVRSSGTFSFTNGAQLFFTIVAAIVLEQLITKSQRSNLLLLLAVFALVSAVPLSGSRSLVVGVGIVVAAATVSDFERVWIKGRLFAVAVVALIVVAAASQLEIFGDALDTFGERFTNASEVEGGVGGTFESRILGGFTSGFSAIEDTPFLGYGLGMGSNVAAILQTGSSGFLLHELEWPRTVQEMGPIVGSLMLALRVVALATILSRALKAPKASRMLALLLTASIGPILLTSNISQPTFLGFITVFGGAAVAASRPTR